MVSQILPGTGCLGLPCWISLPEKCSANAIPLVLVHGISRRAREQIELLGEQAVLSGRPVIAPRFGKKHWKGYQQVVRNGRADLALLGLMQKLRSMGIWQSSKFELAGYSGGAQFAHRFSMLYPHLVKRLTVAAAGWYTFPDDRPYPYGFGRPVFGSTHWGRRMSSRFSEFLTIPIQAVCGELDNQPDKVTRSNNDINEQQGGHRLVRARNWVAALQKASHQLALPEPSISFHKLPGCQHSFSQCVTHGGLDRIIFAKTNNLKAGPATTGAPLFSSPGRDGERVYSSCTSTLPAPA